MSSIKELKKLANDLRKFSDTIVDYDYAGKRLVLLIDADERGNYAELLLNEVPLAMARLPKVAKKISRFEYALGDKGLDEITWQQPFPDEVKCIHCGAKARPVFTLSDDQIPELHENDMGGEEGFWPHDSTAVTVYFCRECAEPTALFNQA
jgi:hypothetical protein